MVKAGDAGVEPSREERGDEPSDADGAGGAVGEPDVVVAVEEVTGPVEWRLQVRFWGVVAGLVLGLSLAVLAQQYSMATLSTTSILLGLLFGVFVGIAVPSIARAVAVWRHNRRLRRHVRVRSERGEGAGE